MLAKPFKNFRLTIFTRQKLWGLSFVLPAFLFFVVFAFYPMINAFLISLTQYDLITPPKFVGLDNYLRMVNDPRFRIVVKNTVVFVIGSSIPTWIISLGLALVLARNFTGRNFVRTLYFLPVIVSGVVVSMVWRMLYHPF